MRGAYRQNKVRHRAEKCNRGRAVPGDGDRLHRGGREAAAAGQLMGKRAVWYRRLLPLRSRHLVTRLRAA